MLLQLHLHSRLNTLLQLIGQRQLQDKTRNIEVQWDLMCLLLEIWRHFFFLLQVCLFVQIKTVMSSWAPAKNICNLQVNRTGIRNYIHSSILDVTTHPCPNFNMDEGHWSVLCHCTLTYIQVRCCYNEVNFLPNPHKIYPIAHPLGRDMRRNLWFDTLIYILLQSMQ